MEENNEEVLIEIINDKCKAYYKGFHATADTAEEAIIKVEDLYQNRNNLTEANDQEKDQVTSIGVISLVFFILGIIFIILPLGAIGLFSSILAIMFGGWSMDTPLGRVSFFGGILLLIFYLVLLQMIF